MFSQAVFFWFLQGGWMFVLGGLIGFFFLCKIGDGDAIAHSLYTLLWMLGGLIVGPIVGLILGGGHGFEGGIVGGPVVAYFAYLIYIFAKIYPNDSYEGRYALIGWIALPIAALFCGLAFWHAQGMHI